MWKNSLAGGCSSRISVWYLPGTLHCELSVFNATEQPILTRRSQAYFQYENSNWIWRNFGVWLCHKYVLDYHDHRHKIAVKYCGGRSLPVQMEPQRNQAWETLTVTTSMFKFNKPLTGTCCSSRFLSCNNSWNACTCSCQLLKHKPRDSSCQIKWSE